MSARSAPRPSSGALDHLGLVVLALVPFLASDPGRVAADSRQYLYLDPGEFLRRAVSLWDPSVAAGTVPHQHLGFLWPMGPWFWLADTVDVPMWVAQRLWLAAIAAAAGLGTLRLCRDLGLGRGPAVAAAVVYQLTPYQLAFTARFSVLLLPWAALPWLVLLARRAVREGSWRAPVLFGLVAATAGAVNASSLVLVLVAPAAVLLVALRRGPPGRAIGAGARIALVTAGASAWWASGLVVQGRDGLPVLQLTENVDTVSAGSPADEVIRGLGNWVFLSTDGSSALEQAAAYRGNWFVRLATVALPATAVGLLAHLRFRGRAAMLALLTSVTVFAVGAAPVDDPSPYGRLWRWFSETSSVGLALRNAPRIVPVLVLLTGVVLAVGAERLTGRHRRVAVGAIVAVALVAIAPVARHGFLASDFDRPEDLPDHWLALADDLDEGDDPSRVLELPGTNFAAHEWGNTVEPVLPGLLDRPTIAREVLPAGGPGTVDLLAALDRRLQRGTFDPDSLAPVARILGAGDVVIRGDLDSDRFGLPDARALAERLLDEPPPGFSVAGTYGGTPESPLLLRLRLDDPAPRLRADDAPPILLDGSGDGIVDAAAAGILDGTRPILPAVSLDDTAIGEAVRSGADVLVTDSARKRATTFFYTIVDDTGATEPPGRREPDPLGYDVRLGPYANAEPGSQTVALQLGADVEASVAGSPEHPEHRAVHVFDRDPATEWRPHVVAPWGQWVEARLDEPADIDELTVLVAPGPAQISEVALTVDGRRSLVALDERARRAPGQTVPVGAEDAGTVRIEITGVTGDPGIPGLAEVRLGDVAVDEVLLAPVDLAARADLGPDNGLAYVFTRDRGNPAAGTPPVERDIDRAFDVPATTTFELTATNPTSQRRTLAGECDASLVQVDGAGFPVRVGPGPEGGALLTGCDELHLAPGRHRLTTSRDAPVTIDQVVLRAPGTTPPRSATGIEITTDDARHVEGRVAPAGGDPFWLVLAESRNDGWDLDVDGGRVLSEALVDGYANGWLVAPEGDRVDVSLRWTPQRIVWAGMAVSALTVVLAAGYLVLTRRRSREAAPGPWLDDERWSAPARGRSVVAVTVASAALWWFVAGPLVAAVAVAAVLVRLRAPTTALAMAVGAGAAVVLAEVGGWPALVHCGLALAAAAVLGDQLVGRAGDQPPMSAFAEAPG